MAVMFTETHRTPLSCGSNVVYTEMTKTFVFFCFVSFSATDISFSFGCLGKTSCSNSEVLEFKLFSEKHGAVCLSDA